jgi:hypothetical protein
MKESYRKDLATHPDPESCDSGRKTTGEALTGAHAGQPSSCVITVSGLPTLSTQAEGNTVGGAKGKPSADPAQSKTLRMRGNSLHGNREIPQASAPGVADRPEKVVDRTSGMYACGKSDGRILPGKPPNKGMRLAEAVEGRRPAKGNTRFRATCRTQSRVCVLLSDPGVREAASAASPPLTRGGSRMREIRSYGSVRGAGGNPSPYRDKPAWTLGTATFCLIPLRGAAQNNL